MSCTRHSTFNGICDECVADNFRNSQRNLRPKDVLRDEPSAKHYVEVFSNKFGSTKAVVCSCGFATTYSVLSNDADEQGRAFFDERHAASKLSPVSPSPDKK